MRLVANARMYAVNAGVAARWSELFAWLAKRAGIALDVIEHRAPAPLDALWRRDDLGAGVICGYPLALWHEDSRPAPLAVPVPKAEPFGARPVYWSDIVVRADSVFERDDDLAGARFGWTIEASQSGYQAPRHHFAARALDRGGRFFAATIGPLVTPRRVVESILEGTVDAGAVDAYWHELLRLHEPRTAARLRTIARTEATPMPCFVAASVVPDDVRKRIAQAFVDSAGDATAKTVLAGLALERFDRIDAAGYEIIAERARAVDALGYAHLR